MGELQVIGAGLPRTGTTSLKAGLERLLDGPCYHMFELHQRFEEDFALWGAALDGDLKSLDAVTDGWNAAVDWPASLFWRELAERNPSAKVVLSHRASPDQWWQSADATVWKALRDHQDRPVVGEFNAKMVAKAGMGDDFGTKAGAQAYYQRQLDGVTAAIAPERLIMWEPSQGWQPLCEGLGLDVPDEPFGHHNTTADFEARVAANDARRLAEREADA